MNLESSLNSLPISRHERVRRKIMLLKLTVPSLNQEMVKVPSLSVGLVYQDALLKLLWEQNPGQEETQLLSPNLLEMEWTAHRGLMMGAGEK